MQTGRCGGAADAWQEPGSGERRVADASVPDCQATAELGRSRGVSSSAAYERFYRQKKVLVTGGLGFIGSNLVRQLVELEATVTVVDSLIPEYGGNLRNLHGLENRVKINISDVRDRHSLPVFVQGQDVLFNLAGQTSHMDSMADPHTDLEINARAQLSILEVCRKFNSDLRIVFASTRQLYGRPDYLPVDEDHPLRPVDVNGINKLAGENYHLLYHQVYGIPSCVLRLTNTIGPRMRIKDARQTFLGVWIRSILKGQPFEVWGGDQKRDFTYVSDAVEALLLAGGNPAAAGRVYNVGGTAPVTLAELATLLVSVAGKGTYATREYPADRKRIDIGDFFADDRRIRAELQWKPQVTLEEALGMTVRFFAEELDHYL
jgi:UDP-glucose 4-epimerase